MTGSIPELPRAEPRYFGPADRARFGWLHRPAPAAPTRSVGVVICNPFGYEALCAHRTLRHLAETAASLGYPTLRFDYDGTGDSAGSDLDPDRWTAWRASVLDAVVELRAASGATRVCLLGVRLGAMIAAVAAADSQEIAGLAMLAPVASGRPWLRELRALQAAMGRAEAPAEFALPNGVQESVGLLLSEDTRDRIAATDIGELAARLPREVLLIDRTDRPPLSTLVDRLRATGATVQHVLLPGYVEMTLDPHEAVIPTEILGEFARWLLVTFPATSTAPSKGFYVPRAGPLLVSAGVGESADFLDEGRRLFGIVSVSVGMMPRQAVVLLNAGANHHIGNGRLYVELARRLAALGWLVLRYDVSGIGDSLPRPGAPENEVYTPNAVPDLRDALEFLRSRYALDRIEAFGLCSGAYHGLKGAVAGLPLTGVVVVNPLVFFWKKGMSLAYPPFRMVQAAAQYRRSMLQPEKWLKLLRGRVDLGELAAVVVHWLTSRAQSMRRELAWALRLSIADDLAAELEAITERGIVVRFLFSAGDPGEALLREGAGSQLGRLECRGALRIDHLIGCDHSLSSAWMHEVLWTALGGYLRDQ